MKKITAPTLQNALSQAALEFGCSVTELEYEVIQYESKGVFGLFKKPAIIIANITTPIPSMMAPLAQSMSANRTSHATPKSNTQSASSFSGASSQHSSEEFFDASDFLRNSHDQNPRTEISQPQAFQTPTFQTKEEVIQEITSHIKEMFSYIPYQIHTIQVSFYDPQTLYIYLDGPDSALLIGERGYRYKALSYLLFNWIQPAYGYNIRLEIAQFLHNQEEAIDAYLVGIINEVRREGKAQTKPLDGILAFIALKKLREQLPDKYISFRQNPQNERYIVINDFYH